MTMKLEIGTCEGKPLHVDLAELATLLDVSHLGRNGHAHKTAGTATPEPTRDLGRSQNEISASRGQSDITLGDGADRRILTALAQYQATGLASRRCATLAGVKQGGSSWRGAMARLRKAGWVSESGDVIGITDAGRAALGKFEELPTGPEMLNRWRAKLGKGALLQMFNHLVSARGAEVTPEELAAAVPCEQGGSSYRGALARLRNLGLVPKGKLAAAAELFE